jgi:hypothetical protein
MKILEVLVESKQLQEGPLANKIGTAIGKGVGVLGKGIGAAAGGVVGLGKAIKKGYQAGRDVVGMAGDAMKSTSGSGKAPSQGASAQAGQPAAAQSVPAAQAAAPAQATTATQTNPTAAAPSQSTATPPSTSQINKAGPQGAPMARAVQGAGAKQALARTTAATAQQAPDAAADTLYSQVKANVEKLDKKGKQRLLVLLQKSIAQHAARTKPAVAAPAAQPAAAPATPTPAAGATAKPAPAGKKPVKIASKKKAPTAAAAPAAQPQTASIVHNGKVIAEGLSLFRKS